MNRLRGKTALVFGSATGIGREVARLFAAEGAAVALGDRDPEALEELVPLIGAAFASRSTSPEKSKSQPPSRRRSRASAGSISWSTTPALAAAGARSTSSRPSSGNGFWTSISGASPTA